MQVERVWRDTMKLLQAMFSKTPEALNAVDMVRAAGELVLSMMDSVMFRVTDINQAIVAAPAVRVDDCLRSNATANNGLQSSLRAVGHDLGIDFAVSLQQPEDGSLATCPASVLPRTLRAPK